MSQLIMSQLITATQITQLIMGATRTLKLTLPQLSAPCPHPSVPRPTSALSLKGSPILFPTAPAPTTPLATTQLPTTQPTTMLPPAMIPPTRSASATPETVTASQAHGAALKQPSFAADRERATQLAPLCSARTGVPLTLLLELNPRGYRQSSPFAPLEAALSALLGLNSQRQAQGLMLPEHYQTVSESYAQVQAFVQQHFRVPPAADFSTWCHRQVQLRLQQQPDGATWLTQFKPHQRLRLYHHPELQLVLLAAEQWYQWVHTWRRSRSSANWQYSPPVRAPWALRLMMSLNMVQQSEQAAPNKLKDSRLMRVQLKALASAYLEFEQRLMRTGRALLPTPIISGVGLYPDPEHENLLSFELSAELTPIIERFYCGLVRVGAQLERPELKLFVAPTGIAHDRAWSAQWHHHWYRAQCYDYCVRIYAYRHPRSQVAYEVQATSNALHDFQAPTLRAHPELIAKQHGHCSRRQLLTPVPRCIMDFLALSQYVHAYDAGAVLQGDAPLGDNPQVAPPPVKTTPTDVLSTDVLPGAEERPS